MQGQRSDPHLGRLVEETEAAAWVSLANSVRKEQPPLHLYRVGGATVLVGAERGARAQQVFCLGMTRPADDQALTEILAIFQQHGIRSFKAHICPTARPATLRRWLLTRGFVEHRRDAILIRFKDAASPGTPFHRIRPLQEDDVLRIVDSFNDESRTYDIRGWGSAVLPALDKPDWRWYVALDGGVPIAMAGMFLHQSRAWVAPFWTVPAFRGRGAQADLLGELVREADREGCDWMTTAFEGMPQRRPRNFERAGFELLYMRTTYAYEAPAS